MGEKCQLRTVTVRGVLYLRVEDVATYLRDIAATEETDVRNRLMKAAKSLLNPVSLGSGPKPEGR